MHDYNSMSPRRGANGTPPRRLDGWGFSGVGFPPSPSLLEWLRTRLGAAEPIPALHLEDLNLPSPKALPELGCPDSCTPLDRLAHAAAVVSRISYGYAPEPSTAYPTPSRYRKEKRNSRPCWHVPRVTV